jgi:hypothetical protein
MTTWQRERQRQPERLLLYTICIYVSNFQDSAAIFVLGIGLDLICSSSLLDHMNILIYVVIITICLLFYGLNLTVNCSSFQHFMCIRVDLC